MSCSRSGTTIPRQCSRHTFKGMIALTTENVSFCEFQRDSLPFRRTLRTMRRRKSPKSDDANPADGIQEIWTIHRWVGLGLVRLMHACELMKQMVLIDRGAELRSRFLELAGGKPCRASSMPIVQGRTRRDMDPATSARSFVITDATGHSTFGRTKVNGVVVCIESSLQCNFTT